MNCFLFIFMITLAVATSNPVDDDNCNEKLQKAKEHASKAHRYYIDILGDYNELNRNNSKLQQVKDNLEKELGSTQKQLQSSQQELRSAKNTITRLENEIRMLKSTTPAPTTPEPTTPEPTTPKPITPATTLSYSYRIAKCGVISSIDVRSITASSIKYNDPGFGPQHARLNIESGEGGWTPHTYEGSWIQLDLGTKKSIKGVATEGGRTEVYSEDWDGSINEGYDSHSEHDDEYYIWTSYYDHEWVTTFSISYKSSPYSSFQYVEDQSGAKKIFQGNTNRNSVVINDISIDARFVRLHPRTWHKRPKLQFDILTC